MLKIKIVEVSANNEEIQNLINKLDDVMREKYAHYELDDGQKIDDWLEHWTELNRPHVTFVAAKNENDEFIGMAAMKDMDGYSELKRVYVEPDYRGLNIADQLIAELEAQSTHDTIKLETGTEQPDAIRFFKRMGYIECEAFGSYADELYHEASVFMEKDS